MPEFDDPKELINYLKELSEEPQIIFRGESNAELSSPLMPKIFRTGKQGYEKDINAAFTSFVNTKEKENEFEQAIEQHIRDKDAQCRSQVEAEEIKEKLTNLAKRTLAEIIMIKRFVDFSQDIGLGIPNADEVLAFFRNFSFEHIAYKYTGTTSDMVDVQIDEPINSSDMVNVEAVFFKNNPNGKSVKLIPIKDKIDSFIIIRQTGRGYHVYTTGNVCNKISVPNRSDLIALRGLPEQADEEKLTYFKINTNNIELSIKKALTLLYDRMNEPAFFLLNTDVFGSIASSNGQMKSLNYSEPVIYHNPSFYPLIGLAQHHGIPTRFLDWTHNPLTALYFAANNEDEEDAKNIAIWALNIKYLDNFHVTHSALANSNFTQLPFQMIDNIYQRANPFLRAQKGLFIFPHGANKFYCEKNKWPGLREITDSHHSFFKRSFDNESFDINKLFIKITFPVDRKNQLLKTLWQQEKKLIHHFMPSHDFVAKSVLKYPEIIG